ncbi:hypothetical protein [Nocardia sp. NPDC057353]|uniref:hypothetical protein n=1 Tax=Nocardia sp. NPDC057353 TaxID=3346104 RepID=UPI00363F3821
MDAVAQHVLWFAPMLWAGMVLAISFLEAPLKFRAPGVTTVLGLGIGRVVFAALERVQLVVAALLLIAAAVLGPGAAVWAWLGGAVALLAIQVLVIRPPLSRRSDRVLAGEELPRSHAHYWYIGAEVAKLVALFGLAIVAAA